MSMKSFLTKRTEKGKSVKPQTPPPPQKKSYYKNKVWITNFQVKFQHRISKISSCTNSKKNAKNRTRLLKFWAHSSCAFQATQQQQKIKINKKIQELKTKKNQKDTELISTLRHLCGSWEIQLRSQNEIDKCKPIGFTYRNDVA